MFIYCLSGDLAVLECSYIAEATRQVRALLQSSDSDISPEAQKSAFDSLMELTGSDESACRQEWYKATGASYSQGSSEKTQVDSGSDADRRQEELELGE